MRSCDGCTKCCEGWLTGDSHGHNFWPGRPCHFCAYNGCSIYDNRPDEPCKSFQCGWLKNEDIPAWMKPDKINVIINTREENGKTWLELTEAGSRLDPRVLSWAFMKYNDGKIPNLKYQIDGGWNYIWR